MTRKPTITQLAAQLKTITENAISDSGQRLEYGTYLTGDTLVVEIFHNGHKFFSDSFDLEAMRNEEGNTTRFDVIRKRIEDSISAHCYDEAEAK